MPRFYCPISLSPGAVVALPPEVAHHIHVLRLGPEDPLTLFNGEGGEFQARLAGIGKKSADAEILSFLPREAELPYAVTIAQALPESSKMDWIVEKAIELGATAIQPLHAHRCVVRLSGDRAEKRLAHWQKIVVSASEQCGRNRLTLVHDIADFRKFTTNHDGGKRLLLSPRATVSLAAWAQDHSPQPLTLMIGPEGGFTEAEEDLAITQGAQPISMGSRILRTETAGMAALAMLQGIWDRQ